MTLSRLTGRKIGIALLLTAGCSLAVVRPADAAFKLRLTQGVNVVTITDGGVGDLAVGIPGEILFSGAVGVFQINNVTGLSKGVLASSPHESHMDLASVDTSCVAVACAGGLLTIELTDTGFDPLVNPGTLIGAVGGTVNGSALFKGYKNGTNAEFAVSPIDVSIGPFVDAVGGITPTAFSGTDSQPHGPIAAYSMTMVASIRHPGDRALSTSFNFALDNVPEPATMTLFGIGLLGVGLATRRRRQAQSL